MFAQCARQERRVREVRRIGILLFDGVEELDVVGPYEVFGWAGAVRKEFASVCTVAERDQTIRWHKGLRIIPDCDFDHAPEFDVLIVPGGAGTRREVSNARLISWVAAQAARSEWVAGICTGTRLLIAAGPARGKRVTTYFGAIDELRAQGQAGEVLDNVRFVRDGNLLTSAGVSAGIDMALWLVGELANPAFARSVQQGIEYFPAPPYAYSI
jgi:putative intracellular protease/amidase